MEGPNTVVNWLDLGPDFQAKMEFSWQSSSFGLKITHGSLDLSESCVHRIQNAWFFDPLYPSLTVAVSLTRDGTLLSTISVDQ